DDNSEGGSGGGGTGGGGQPDKALLRALAELRLLRLMQKGILDGTRDLEDGRQANQPLTPEQEEALAELGRSQGHAREMAGRTAEILRRFRQLAERVNRAGGHMGEAKQGLDGKVTGEPTQGEESKAI